jgi:hypothetical protein
VVVDIANQRSGHSVRFSSKWPRVCDSCRYPAISSAFHKSPGQSWPGVCSRALP